MKKIFVIAILLMLNNIPSSLAQNPYNIDEKELARMQRYDQYMNAFGVQSNMADQYVQQRQVMYEQQMANQASVPYEVYICQGNWQCIQQFELKRRQIQALQNQQVQINADVNYRYKY